uniref:ESX-1 secretion-associated regulator n=1 Tax=Siphoviridae sp. cttDR14 TaxID=2826490 RepID=A0A8S5M2F0_9CAUD|nr:MAG TPA: ESX-1 secretion-associated regulator [Siphoviridae sp. cttDR14]
MVKIALLKQRKKELNLSYDDITARSGCSRRSIIRIFKGDTPCPRIDTLQKIAEVLELPIEELTTDNEYKVTEPLVQTLTPFKQPDVILTDEEKRLVEAFRRLGPTMRASTLNMIESAVASTKQSRNRNIR